MMVLWTGTTISTISTVTAVTAVAVALATLWTTVTTFSALRTITTFAAGWTLHVALGLLNEHTMTQLVLTSLRVNFKELYLNVVAFLDASLFNSLQTLPVNL